MSTASPLHELAAAHGIATEYQDWRQVRRTASDATLRAVLTDLGVDASTPERIDAALAAARAAAAALPPVIIAREGRPGTVPAPTGTLAELVTEDGARRSLGPARSGELALPGDLPLGYHRLDLASPARRIARTLIVVPERIPVPPALAATRQWGTATQVYSMTSARSWGIGDLADLADLARWSGREHGAGFVLVNPLQAGGVVPPLEPSPYLPASRRFTDPLYLAIDRLPEYAALSAAERAEVDRLADAARASLGELIDRDAVWNAKLAALRILFGHVDRAGEALTAYRTAWGRPLTDFATWCALAREHGPRWQDWPAGLRSPELPDVAGYADAHRDEIDFWCWVQYAADAQLGEVQAGARAAGMALGVMHDLAVGVSPDGADAWGLGDVFARSCRVGAPPDAFNQLGQDWGQHPWRPDRLAQVAYAPFRDMVAGILRHAGGLRIDHVMGLFRLWWVPGDVAPTEGTYVHYDHEAMLGILALEAQRAGAVIVGEDLGTVEPEVRTELADRGVLGTSILWFEQDWDAGVPLEPGQWRRDCLASVTTHDLPPTAGYLDGVHIALRDRLGLLTIPVADEEAALAADIARWREMLARHGLLAPGAGPDAMIEGLHAFLGLTPARLLGVSVSDLAGDRRAQNQPGTSDEYPNWRLPLADADGRTVLLEDLIASPRANALAEVMRAASARDASAGDASAGAASARDDSP